MNYARRYLTRGVGRLSDPVASRRCTSRRCNLVSFKHRHAPANIATLPPAGQAAVFIHIPVDLLTPGALLISVRLVDMSVRLSTCPSDTDCLAPIDTLYDAWLTDCPGLISLLCNAASTVHHSHIIVIQYEFNLIWFIFNQQLFNTRLITPISAYSSPSELVVPTDSSFAACTRNWTYHACWIKSTTDRYMVNPKHS